MITNKKKKEVSLFTLQIIPIQKEKLETSEYGSTQSSRKIFIDLEDRSYQLFSQKRLYNFKIHIHKLKNKNKNFIIKLDIFFQNNFYKIKKKICSNNFKFLRNFYYINNLYKIKKNNVSIIFKFYL